MMMRGKRESKRGETAREGRWEVTELDRKRERVLADCKLFRPPLRPTYDQVSQVVTPWQMAR